MTKTLLRDFNEYEFNSTDKLSLTSFESLCTEGWQSHWSVIKTHNHLRLSHLASYIPTNHNFIINIFSPLYHQEIY